MIKCKHNKENIYIINYLEESVVFRLLSTAVASFLLLKRKEILNE